MALAHSRGAGGAGTRCRRAAWQGEALGGKTIHVYGEMGFGDTIQFARYVPLLARLGAKVLFSASPRWRR